MSSPSWWLGTGAVGAGRDIRGPVTVNVIAGTFDRLHDAIFDAKPLWDALDLGRFTGREWLVKEIEDHIAAHRKGYVLVRGEAGVGKSALAARLVWTRPCIRHFTSLPGGRNPEAARRSISAQLIGACGLAESLAPGDAFPAVADRPDWLLRVLQAAAERRDESAGPLVLVVDGLDEAEPTTPGQDTGIPLGLPRPEHLPDGVFVVATSRFGLPLPALFGSALWRVIEADGDQNLCDMREFITDTLVGVGADASLVDRLHARGIASDQFASDLVERCAGIWMYLKYVLDDVRRGRRDPADLASLPVGLAGYYLEQVERWRRAENWRSAGLPALATLAALRRPVRAMELARFSGVAEDSLGEWLDERLRPFLVVTLDQRGHRSWAVRHQSLRDLFEPGTEGEWDNASGHGHALHDALVAAHHRITEVLTPSCIDGDPEWDEIDAYARTELAGHASACGALDELISDAGFLLAADPNSILRQSSTVRSVEGRAALAAYRPTLGDWAGQTATTRAWNLHVWARKTRARRLGTAAQRLSGSAWAVEWASWTGISHMMISVHQGEVLSVAVGRLSSREVVVSGGTDGTVRVWEPGSEAEPLVLSGHQGWVTSVAVGCLFGRDVVVSGGTDGTVRVWEPVTEAKPLVLGRHRGVVLSVAVGRLSGRDVVVSGGWDGRVRVWEPGSEAEPLVLSSHEDEVWSVAVGRLSGREVVVYGSVDGTVRVWEPGSGAEPLALGRHYGVVLSVAVGHLSGRHVIVSGGRDGTVRVWEPGSKAKPLLFGGHHGSAMSVAVARLSGRDVVVSGGTDGTVRVWEPGSKAKPLVLGRHRGGVLSVAVGRLSGRDVVVSGSVDGTVRVWEPGSEAEPLVLGGHRGGVLSATVGRLSGREVVVSGGRDRTLRVWEPGSEAEPLVLGGHRGEVWSVAVGRLSGREVVVSGSVDETVRVWEPGSEAEPVVLDRQQGWVWSVVVDRLSGREVIVTGSVDGTVRVWEPGSEAEPLMLGRHQGGVLSVAVGHLSGRELVVSGGSDGTVRVWESGSEAEPLVLSGHQGSVTSVAVGRLSGRDVVVSGGEDSAILIWVPAGAERAAYPRGGHLADG